MNKKPNPFTDHPALLQQFGVPSDDVEEEAHRIDRAPEKALPFGEAPEGFYDEVVWVKLDEYTGVAYCDDTEPEFCGECDWCLAPDGEEHGDSECFVDMPIIYVGTPLLSEYQVVPPNLVRLATKDEVRQWFAIRRSGDAFDDYEQSPSTDQDD